MSSVFVLALTSVAIVIKGLEGVSRVNMLARIRLKLRRRQQHCDGRTPGIDAKTC
jgi:hypothetical protein